MGSSSFTSNSSTKAQLYREAATFIATCYQELRKSVDEAAQRLHDIQQQIETYGTYEHTFEELEHGARMAWRNSNRCIGRLFWKSLTVFDERSAQTEEDIADGVLRHLDFATNGGKIRPAITIFKPESDIAEVRIWNHQVIRYAGYETEHGMVGDPHSLQFTNVCRQLGWAGQGTHFDVLPLVIQLRQRTPRWFEIPRNRILEVRIDHPEIPAFRDLNLRWYAVPMISDMVLEIGGIRYPAAPFNGWYMGTEIGARNFADVNRYNVLPKVASLLGLDTSRHASLWLDKALVELNVAVLHSFARDGVRIVDHHTAAEQFAHFERLEAEQGRSVTGTWSWLIPPVSPATTHIFNKRYNNAVVKPNYFRQPPPYESVLAP
ncbi:nitric oxide synthase oxygenase [Alicyclobacillus contaminans]|uniref:nitric oxide synthase oxygenase n=1 Tax=Alicyclobacillus contaminans TaxID=392016 RepID=UPI0004203808|nr:nitric oxide synthase oxygenase [Alicyclobacillus contaminans]